MNKTNLLFHLTPEYLPTQAGTIEGAQKAGIKGFYLLDNFNKVFCDDPALFTGQMMDHVDMLYRLVYNNNRQREYPVKEVIISLRSNFWCDMTQAEIDASTCKFKQDKPNDFYETVKYSNRFFPKNISLYKSRLNLFLEYFYSTYPEAFKITTFDLWGEPDASRYWWGTYDEFKELTKIKLNILKYWGINSILMPHLTASTLQDKRSKDIRYADYVLNSTRFNQANLGYSTSLYEHFSNGFQFFYDDNNFPSRKFNRVVFAECGYAAGLYPDSKSIYEQDKIKYFNSKTMMHYFIRLLKFSRLKGSDTVCLFTLCDSIESDSRGELSYWQHHTGGGYTPRPVWFVLLDLLSVIKDGWEETPSGIKGKVKEIELTEGGYVVR